MFLHKRMIEENQKNKINRKKSFPCFQRIEMEKNEIEINE